jgi:MFS family permease
VAPSKADDVLRHGGGAGTPLPLAVAIRLVLPFAAGHFISLFFRTANAVIGPALHQELSLSAGAVGLLTGTYFLAFAAAQIPLGMVLDRVGARRVEAALLLVAAAGALGFASGRDLGELAAARALIGLGVSACLMAALHTFSHWFGSERQASLTAWMMAAGGLGAISASSPLNAVLQVTGWRQVFVGLAVLTAMIAAWVYVGVPDTRAPLGRASLAEQWRGVVSVFRSRHFHVVGPLGFACTGGFFAVQGLWSASWLREVSGQTRTLAADTLAAMNLAMLVTYTVIGLAATSLARRGVSATRMVTVGLAIALTALLLIITQVSEQVRPLWIAYGVFSTFSTLVFPIMAQGYPIALAGRASTALNVMVFLGAFGIQWGMGAAIELLGRAGLDAARAHQATFAGLLALQVTAYAWFQVGRLRGLIR